MLVFSFLIFKGGLITFRVCFHSFLQSVGSDSDHVATKKVDAIFHLPGFLALYSTYSTLSMEKNSFMVQWRNLLLPSIQKMTQTEMNAVSVKLSELNVEVIKIEESHGFISAKYDKMLKLKTCIRRIMIDVLKLTKSNKQAFQHYLKKTPKI